MTLLSSLHEEPYYAVIFTSVLEGEDREGYEEMADKMVSLASQQNGFLGVDSARAEIGITVSYWKDLNSIRSWKQNIEHREAQKLGRDVWYKNYKIRICKVERQYEFENTHLFGLMV